jgi:hypothetical protein
MLLLSVAIAYISNQKELLLLSVAIAYTGEYKLK